MLLLPGVDSEAGLARMEASRERLTQIQLRAAAPGWNVTASIGVAGFDGHPDYERLMARADGAMYAAKNAGRDQVTLAES